MLDANHSYSLPSLSLILSDSPRDSLAASSSAQEPPKHPNLHVLMDSIDAIFQAYGQKRRWFTKYTNAEWAKRWFGLGNSSKYDKLITDYFKANMFWRFLNPRFWGIAKYIKAQAYYKVNAAATCLRTELNSNGQIESIHGLSKLYLLNQTVEELLPKLKGFQQLQHALKLFKKAFPTSEEVFKYYLNSKSFTLLQNELKKLPYSKENAKLLRWLQSDDWTFYKQAIIPLNSIFGEISISSAFNLLNLRCDSELTLNKLEKARRKVASRHHPDKFPENEVLDFIKANPQYQFTNPSDFKKVVGQNTAVINNAFEILKEHLNSKLTLLEDKQKIKLNETVTFCKNAFSNLSTAQTATSHLSDEFDLGAARLNEKVEELKDISYIPRMSLNFC